MKRLVWGIVVAVLGLASFAGASGNPNGPEASITAGLMCVTGGGVLIWFGQKQRQHEQQVGETALRLLQECGHVPCDELARTVRLGEYQARLILRKLQLKGLVPLRVER
ncbi:MAG: hypothetical protein IT164_11630 [Bryobacterales bacterium]|nr:hypothetical protein [Bryobacterales bacterium]